MHTCGGPKTDSAVLSRSSVWAGSRWHTQSVRHMSEVLRDMAQSLIVGFVCFHEDGFMCFPLSQCYRSNVYQSRLPAMAPLRNGGDDPLWTNYPRGAVPVYTPGNCLIPVGRKPVVYRSPIDRGRERIWRNYVKYARHIVRICFVNPCIHFLFRH